MLNIIITRPVEDAEKLAETLSKLGHNPIIEPILNIYFLQSASLELKEKLGKKPQAILLTSANGARALASMTEERKIKIITVGDASAEEAKNLGFKNVTSAGGDVNSLADYVEKNCKKTDGWLLHVAGSVLAGDLQTILKNKGFIIDRVVAYEAEPAHSFSLATKSALINCELDSVLFYSPRTAKIFTELANNSKIAYLLKNTRALCLSEAVAAELEKDKWSKIMVASEPKQESLLSLIESK